MTFKRAGSNFIVKLEKGEEIVQTLSAFLLKYGITAATIAAIGATDEVIIGYYDPEKQEYKKQEIRENLEILNLSGNGSMVQGEPFCHLHILLGDKNYNVRGGHLFSARVSVTCEVHINAMDTVIERAFDSETGLNLLKI